jgi:hypothetical protein
MVEELFLRYCPTFAEAKELQHQIFLAGKMKALGIDLNRLKVEINCEVAGSNDRLRMDLGSMHEGMDARNQFIPVERLRHIVVGTEPEASDLILDAGEARQN